MLAAGVCSAAAQVVVRGKVIHTMGPAGTIHDGVVVAKDGKIAYVGPAASASMPSDAKVIEAAVVTPGLIDAHCAIGLSGIFNQPHDSDQIERSAAIQPELRAIDAYNPQERLIEWVRDLGVTTIHTGHAPGELVPGQTMIVKTYGATVEQALVREPGAVAVTLSPIARKGDNKSPGTRGKMMAMLRTELIKSREYLDKRSKATTRPSMPTGDPKTDEEKSSDRSLRYEALGRVLTGELPLMITCNRAQDIDSALRLAAEFKLRIWLDSASECYLLIDQIKAAGVPVVLHPSMYRASGEMENMSFETAATLRKAGIPVVLQSGYEGYVPKTRVVLWEAAIAASNGLTFEQALATITIDAAKLLGIDARVGSLEVGKDADIACYDDDPFEYTSHCVGTVINGMQVNEVPR